MSKKNQSRCSTLSDCWRGCFDCQCRRRTCTNKILPAIIQIFIVIAVWTILRAQMMPDESALLAEAQAEAAERYARSAQQFERDHNCSMGDYMRGSVLHVDGMLSQAHILVPDANQKRPHFLSVDVLIRDVEEGTMVLYPAGTPVNFGSLNIYYPGEEQAMQELLGERYGQMDEAGSNSTGNGTQVQFENPDDAATNFDVDSIEGHLVPEQQISGQPGLLGQGPLASALFPPGQQPFLQEPNAAYGQNFPNAPYPGGPPGLYPNQGQLRGGAPLPLSLGDMGIPGFGGQRSQVSFGSNFNPGMAGQPPFGGAPLSPGAPGAPGQGNGQSDQNLVLERKPDGGYSLKFKKPGEEAGHDGQPMGGPGNLNVPGAAGDLNIGGQGFQFGQRRFGALQQPAQGLERSRFPFGPQGQGQGPLGSLRGQAQPGSPLNRLGQMAPVQPGQSLLDKQPTGDSPLTKVQDQSEDTVKPTANLTTPSPIPATPTDQSPLSEGDKSEEGDSTTENPLGETENDNKDESENKPDENEKSSTGDEKSEETTGEPAVDTTLFADGFEERLKKYKIELFGKETDDKGEDGSMTGTYRMNNPDICQKYESIDILYLIASKPQSMDVRDRIRQGYVDKSLFENVKMAHVFLVGLTNSPNFLKNLDTEKESYNDVAMGEYMDAPENSTLKALSGFRWARQYCKQAQHIFYVDESIFVDTDKLAHGLIPTADKVSDGKYMLCPFMPSFPIPRQGPNAVKKPLFPTSTNFRSYCKSYAVLLSRSAMMSMIEASEQMAMFPAPDIYLFGYVPYLIGNMDFYDVGSKRAFHDFGQEVVSCYEEQKDRCPILASKASSARFETLFTMMKDRMKTPHAGWDGDNTVWDLKSFKRII